MHRRVFIAAGSLSLGACAARDFKPLEFAPPVPLQDPLPGRAIVYLMRTPNERDTIAVFTNQRLAAVLPPETYTAVSLRPGRYAVSASSSPAVAAPEGVEPSVLTVTAGERRFHYTAIPTRSSLSAFPAPVGAAGFVPLFVPSRQPTGARFWRECSEQDAQGLLSIARAVLPERESL
jgi:hypothetical protein